MTRRWVLWFCLVFLAGPAEAALVADAEGVPAGPPVAVLDASVLARGRLPEETKAALAGVLAGGRGLLFVGRTDPTGPEPVNRELGLVTARAWALRAAGVLGADPERFAAASAGEGPAPEVRVYAWDPPAEPRRPPGPVTVLDPAPGAEPAGRIWAMDRPDGSVWMEAGGSLWAYRPDRPLWELPLPAGGAVLGGVEGGAVRTTELPPAGPGWPELRARVEGGDDWWARVSVDLPGEARDAVLWAGGVPYPVPPGPRAEVPVLLFPQARTLRLEATDAEGRRRAGPAADLPAGQGETPEWAVVVTWSGDDLDLDLWATDGRRRTAGPSPDPLFDPTAVPGVRHLFDSGLGGPSAALAGWGDPEGVRVWVSCFADLGRAGGRARAWWISRPGDPLEETIRPLGPRRVSQDPLWAAWRVR